MTEVSYYNTFALISLIVFVLLVILDVIIWIKLDIRHYFAVLSGSEARKTIDKIKQDAESGAVQADRRRRGGNAAISWNTSEGLEEKTPFRQPLSMDPDKTVLLGQGTALMQGANPMQGTAPMQGTTLLPGTNPMQGTAPMQETTLLQSTTAMQADPYATMVLNTINQQTRPAQQPAFKPQPAPQTSTRYETEGPQLYKPVSMPGFVVEKEIVNTAGSENNNKQ